MRAGFDPHFAPNGFRKYKFLILSELKKIEEYFQGFRLFFISLKIKKLRLMKRLGAECGF